MLIAFLPVVIALVGFLMYILAANVKVVELGRILFFVGALVSTWGVASDTLRIGNRAVHADRAR